MRFTTLITTFLLLCLSQLVSGYDSSDNTVLDQNGEPVDKVHVNPDGELVYEYAWGRYASSGRTVAQNSTCGTRRLDPAGRLGKRAVECPTGYSVACDAYSANPCCPNEAPTCCTGASVCCGLGQFCQGASTCCDIGKVGCGEGCCNYGETCCGSQCCAAGFTCSAGTCVPPINYTPPPSSSTPTPTYSGYTRETYAYNSGTVVTVIFNSTIVSRATTITTATTTAIVTHTIKECEEPGSCVPRWTLVIVGVLIGAFALALIALAYWLFRRKQFAEHQYAEACAAKPAEEPKPTPYTPAPDPDPTPASYTPTKDTPAQC